MPRRDLLREHFAFANELLFCRLFTCNLRLVIAKAYVAIPTCLRDTLLATNTTDRHSDSSSSVQYTQ